MKPSLNEWSRVGLVQRENSFSFGMSASVVFMHTCKLPPEICKGAKADMAINSPEIQALKLRVRVWRVRV